MRPSLVVAAGGLMLAAPFISVAAQKKPVTQPLVTSAVAGQGVAIVPFSLVVVEPSVPAGTFKLDRAGLLRWADSMLVDGAQSRAPEVKWIPPSELRRISRRGAGLIADPDQLGQSIMRSWGLQSVPDPLRSNLRKLLAVAGGWRYALIPASLSFQTDSTGVLAANMSILLADVRSGKVVWRSVAKGRDGAPGPVLGKAIATVFPVEGEP
jgi:hypothetical protein